MSNKGTTRCLQMVSGLVIALGLVHVVATPHIFELLRGSPPAVYERALGPTLLNHVLAGILLLPLGFTTWLAAVASERGEAWAVRVLVANTIAVFTLPMSLLVFMRRSEYYTAPLFVIGVVLTCSVSILMALATMSVVQRHWRSGQQKRRL